MAERFVGQSHGSSTGHSDGTRGEASVTKQPGSKTPVSYQEAIANPRMGAIQHPGPAADVATEVGLDKKPMRPRR